MTTILGSKFQFCFITDDWTTTNSQHQPFWGHYGWSLYSSMIEFTFFWLYLSIYYILKINLYIDCFSDSCSLQWHFRIHYVRRLTAKKNRKTRGKYFFKAKIRDLTNFEAVLDVLQKFESGTAWKFEFLVSTIGSQWVRTNWLCDICITTSIMYRVVSDVFKNTGFPRYSRGLRSSQI